MLTSSSGTNYALNEHEGLGKYGPYAIPSEMMAPGVSPASLVILFDKQIFSF